MSKTDLEIAFLLPLAVGLSIGLYGVQVLYRASGGNFVPPSVLVLFIVLETFFLFAYNTNYAGERLHNDVAFAFAWALLPFLTSYYVHSLAFTGGVVLTGLASSLFTKSNAISPVPVATSSTRAFASSSDTSRTACLHAESFRNVRRESKVSYSLGAPLKSLCIYCAFSCTEYHLT